MITVAQIGSGGGGPVAASAVEFTPADTLTSTNVQAAIVEALEDARTYTSAFVRGLDVKQSARCATMVPLPANTRTGNILTASANGALPTTATDDVAVVVGNRVVVNAEVNGVNNGIFTVTSLGSAGTPWSLTRATDMDVTAEVSSGVFVPVTAGSHGPTGWVLTTLDPITLNITALTFAELPQVQTASAVPFTPAAGIGATDVQAAVVEALTDAKAYAESLTSAHPAHYMVPDGTPIQIVINQAVTDGHTVANPAWVVMQADRDENVTLAPGVYLTGRDGFAAASPTLTGLVSVLTNSGTLAANVFSMDSVNVVGPINYDVVQSSGSAPHLFLLSNCIITATGATYAALSCVNSNAATVIRGRNIELRHTVAPGSASTYAMVVSMDASGTVDIDGFTAAPMTCRSMNLLTGSVTIRNAKIDTGASAMTSSAIRVGDAALTLVRSDVYNTQTDATGIILVGTASLRLRDVYFNVTDGANQCVESSATSTLRYGNVTFYPGSNTRLDLDSDPTCMLTAPPRWVDATYNTGWGDYDYPDSNKLQYFKDAAGKVTLRGYVTHNSGTDQRVFRLPAGYRPVKNHHFPARNDSNGGILEVRVWNDGWVDTDMNLLDGITLDHIYFYTN